MIASRFFSFILFCSLLSTCVTNSEGRKTLLLIGDSQMNSMGATTYGDILATAKKENKLLASSTAKHEAVERIGKRIAAVSGATFDWEFHVIDEPKTANAFCLPGGKIAVYTGILPVAQTEAALAVVMGHEVAHALLRHGAERISQQLALQSITSAADFSLRDSKSRQIWLGVIGLGANYGVILPYSRRHESEADSLGLKLAAKAGYDPSVAPKLWERMGKGGEVPPEFLSTHPNPINRAKALQDMQESVRPLYLQSERQEDKPLPQ